MGVPMSAISIAVLPVPMREIAVARGRGTVAISVVWGSVAISVVWESVAVSVV
jgi:hypothetical protein